QSLSPSTSPVARFNSSTSAKRRMMALLEKTPPRLPSAAGGAHLDSADRHTQPWRDPQRTFIGPIWRGTRPMREAVIVSTARTPIGKAVRGAFNNTHGAAMTGHVIKHAVDRAKLDPSEVEDVVIGCANPEGATGHNIARDSVIRAGLPVTVPGETINRFCSSGLMAISIAAQRIMVDGVDVAVGGGVESISLVQFS